MNATATANTLKNLLAALVEDLRRRRLLPVVGVLVAALVAVPIVLGRSASPAPVAPHPATGGAPIDTSTGAGAAKPTTAHARRLSAHGRDPFAAGHAAAGAATATGGSAAGVAAVAAAPTVPASVATSAAPASPGITHTATTTAPARTVTRTVTVTTPAPAPRPVYAAYLTALSFGQTGQAQQRLSPAPRFTVLPSLHRVAAIFLGILGNGRSAAFLVSNRAAVTGDGSCHPSRANCVYLTLRPGSEELFLLHAAGGRTFEYALRYRGVRVEHSTTVPRPTVSKPGRRLVDEVAKLLPSLRTLRYSQRTGLMSLDRLRR
jgi:hypothetical protein